MLSPSELIEPFLVEDDQGPRTLRARVATHVETIRAAAERNELLPVELAEAMSRRLTSLLDALDAFPTDHQRLILAAARYFVSNADHRPDTVDARGLDDDLLVLNFVVTTLGRPELAVEDA